MNSHIDMLWFILMAISEKEDHSEDQPQYCVQDLVSRMGWRQTPEHKTDHG